MSMPHEKPRLSEQQKKENHIASEQKRRQAIREGFDRIADIVPGMKGLGRSEAVVLQTTVKFMREQIAHKEMLRAKATKELGISNSDFESMYKEEAERGAQKRSGLSSGQ
ncbi:hypothetical protein H2203_002631 [Taxawa tesnikishii (nom. ined.)]|nr:hypothetical protein H2203_002631 [Dothideales sp. JES 119]